MQKIVNFIPGVLPGQTRPANTASSSAAEKCPHCGEMISPVRILGRYILPACKCRDADYEKQKGRQRQQEKKARLEKIMGSCGLGPRFSHCCFDNWQKRPGTEKAFAAALQYARDIGENIKKGRGLLFFGQPGNGKSHLMAAIVNTAARQGRTAIFERVPKLLLKIRGTYGTDKAAQADEVQIIRALSEDDLLVLDDAAAEKWSQWTEPTLYTIIDERYSGIRPLLVTTNSDLEGLAKKVGDRAMDRLLETCRIVENKGTSYRQQISMNNLQRDS